MSSDATITNAGILTIANNAVALTTDTTGNYVLTGASGSGVSLTGGGSEGATLTAALTALTADWSQTGAFDVVLGNASSELKILESVGATFYGILDVTDLAADRTYTFPNNSGTIALTSDITGTNSGTNTGDVTLSGTPDYLTITGQVITRNQIDLTTDVTGVLPVGNGGTGAATFTANGVIYGNTAGVLQVTAAGTNGQS